MAADSQFLIGLDIGSTTVKAVVAERATREVVWQDYQRHETRQAEMVEHFLERIEQDIGARPEQFRLFLTGSGSQVLSEPTGGKFVQEVNAVSLAVEKFHPEAFSVIELGGQDAKIIIFQEQPGTRQRRRITSMNDKCAGGTGAVIDKLRAKLNIAPQLLCNLPYNGTRVHRVAGKCGVFAETDINGLQKLGVPSTELMASLFEALVLQNLTVLTRGHTLHPHVLLLGGPNTFLEGLRQAWQANICAMWRERGVAVPEGLSACELIRAPENSQYFAALGAIEYGAEEPGPVGRFQGAGELRNWRKNGRSLRAFRGMPGLVAGRAEAEEFRERHHPPVWSAPAFEPGSTVRAFLGLDGGSTSTKAVLISETGEVLAKAYQLSKGNPIEDSVAIIGSLRQQVERAGAALEVLSAATTGYAKDVLKDVLQADVALVETVAHARSAASYDSKVDVIVDVGGQDIKLMVLKDGHVKDFMLNTQCSAGNGYFLQATAESFGVAVEDYAEHALRADRMPEFGYGCAVFLQSDIVNFQRQGWKANEILAGLAAVLPKNIWLYVAKIPNLASLGARFLLQGGTQRNLAAVKSQADYIRSRFEDARTEPEITVHPHCGEAGAIGAAIEARDWHHNHGKTSFLGLDAVASIQYESSNSEQTRCHFCKNECLRTFLDIEIGSGEDCSSGNGCSPDFVPPVRRRLILANCEKGRAEDLVTMRSIKAHIDQVKEQNPNLLEFAAREVFRPTKAPRVADPIPGRAWSPAARERREKMLGRSKLRIGIPRVLNFYVYAPLFNGYLESLGIPASNIVYSDYTTDAMYRQGAKRGAIDPCFPSKVVIAHIENLLQGKHKQNPLDVIFLPMFDVLRSPLVNVQATNACPTVIASPEVARAAFIKEKDIFAEAGVQYLHPFADISSRDIFAWQMFQAWGPVLGLSEEENFRAVQAAFAAQDDYERRVRKKARETLDMLERERRIGIVVLGRPYHHDPGLNHEIFGEFQKRGYPVFSQNTLPLDEDLLERLFGAEVRAGLIQHPLDITDVWKHAFSSSTSMKLWAAKFTARHPNLVAVEISNFKCGHDAAIYDVVEEIIERSGTPYFAFKDIDENKPAGAFRIRIETIDYFLKNHREHLAGRWDKLTEIDTRVGAYMARLREGGRASTATV